jgi:hypothetical protein
MEHRRHVRKYATGELDPRRSFYFRGPGSQVQLRAANLLRFIEAAYEVDDETWLYHLRRGDVSRWFREIIQDEALASEADRAHAMANAAANETRELIRHAAEERYTVPG